MSKQSCMGIRWGMMLAAMVGLAPVAASADTITSELLFDINAINIQARDGGGANHFTGVHHTGSFIINSNPESILSLSIDGQPQAGTEHVTVGVSGQIFLDNGVVNHGSLTITAQPDSGPMDIYSFNLQPSANAMLHRIGTTNSYLLSGLTFDGILNNPSFTGTDVGLWYGQQPLLGSFVQFYFRPDSSGADASTYLDVSAYAAVPLPAAAWGGMVLLGLLGSVTCLNRRRGMRQ